jgi:alpha-D-ribose 1-methylphosphonate 5-triphosphate diphosphatase PhnM
MTRCLLFIACLLPAPAWAHLGHVEAMAGHDHWIIAAAIAAALAAVAVGALKGSQEQGSEGEEPEPQEA